MLVESGGLPQWLLVGLLLGAAGSLGVAALFLVAGRVFPSPRATGPTRDSQRRRRAELRAYLQAIEEPYAEDHPVEGQSVAFYLPERDVAITFDARAFYRIERSETTPVLVEHEMPGRQLGARLPFDTPEVDFGPTVEDGPSDPAAQAFRELGVPASATLAQIKAAYRERVKEVHPDHGGDEEAFKRVREAYTTAKQRVGD